MGRSHDAVMEYMEDELKKDPSVKNKTLFAGTREIDESVGELMLQQFHTKYRLPAARDLEPYRIAIMTWGANAHPGAPDVRTGGAA